MYIIIVKKLNSFLGTKKGVKKVVRKKPLKYWIFPKLCAMINIGRGGKLA